MRPRVRARFHIEEPPFGTRHISAHLGLLSILYRKGWLSTSAVAVTGTKAVASLGVELVEGDLPPFVEGWWLCDDCSPEVW